MVEYQVSQLDLVFHALSDATRREIIGLLKNGQKRVSDLAASFEVSLNAVSKHIKVLEKAGIIRKEKVGREYFCYLKGDSLKEAQNWIAFHEQFWNERLDAMDALLTQTPHTDNSSIDAKASPKKPKP